MERKKYDVTGMTCAACQAHVEKAVRTADGVCGVNVNLLPLRSRACYPYRDNGRHRARRTDGDTREIRRKP